MLLFLVTPCLAVAVQPFMEWIPIFLKKREPSIFLFIYLVFMEYCLKYFALKLKEKLKTLQCAVLFNNQSWSCYRLFWTLPLSKTGQDHYVLKVMLKSSCNQSPCGENHVKTYHECPYQADAHNLFPVNF